MGSETIDGVAVDARHGVDRSPAPGAAPDETTVPPADEPTDVVGIVACAVTTMAAAALAVYQANAGNSWTPPFFFDEMWRVDFIRSSHPVDRMLTHDTP